MEITNRQLTEFSQNDQTCVTSIQLEKRHRSHPRAASGPASTLPREASTLPPPPWIVPSVLELYLIR